jgi:hypothetical protein
LAATAALVTESSKPACATPMERRIDPAIIIFFMIFPDFIYLNKAG